MNKVIIALGANTSGAWGTPEQTFKRAPAALAQLGIVPVSVSKLYRTSPVGRSRQPHYLNAVLIGVTNLPPGRLLRTLKKVERAAGRRSVFSGGRRPLDLDVIDHGGRILGWPARKRHRDRVTLPHPEAHRRAFVLVPVLDIAPYWVHPALRISARMLLTRLPRLRGDVRAISARWCCMPLLGDARDT